MAQLVLGPILRHVRRTDATVWVETDAPAEVGVLGSSARTFQVDGHHYALVHVSGLEPGQSVDYSVELDGRRVWPEPGDAFPPPAITTLGGTGRVDVVFGSCRVSLPHEPPWTLGQDEHEGGHGIDALRTLALRLMETAPAERPSLLLMLGDQVYADELSPAMREVTGAREDTTGAAPDELATFDEYAAAYREAWGEPVVRWLLSTIPTAMVFDDHEIHAEWKISQAWLDRMRAKSWYDDRISSGLAAYWAYQHIGNLSPDELRDKELFQRVTAADDAGPLLRREMRDADRQPGHSRWSFARDLGASRLVVIDSRAGREVAPGRRQMIDDGEWDWVTGQATGDFDHLLLASSVPFFLGYGLHHTEAWIDAVTDGAWGRVAARAGEWVRQKAVLDHWASFTTSFDRLVDLLRTLAASQHGKAPASIVLLSGDVHHCYLAEVGFPPGTGAQAPVWQAVCSAYRKDLAPRERAVMRFGNSLLGGRIARALARSAGCRDPRAGWRMAHEPSYQNQVATLTLTPGAAHLRVETTSGADWRAPALRTVFEERLA